jgi:two-component system phosphate regulon sensor histidine kinase PhoR
VKLGIRGKLFLVSLLLITLSMAVANAFLAGELDRELSRKATDELRVRLSLIERDVSAARMPLDDLERWDELADALGTRARGRVTLVRLDGVVIGDTDLDGTALRTVEAHAQRPEVVQALSAGRGSAVRFSDSVRRRMLYVAVPFSRDGVRVGVVRLAEPLTEVDETVASFKRLVVVASVIALGVAVLMASFAAQLMSRSVRQITDSAQRMAGGDLTVRTRMAGTDEVAELGRALDRIAGGLAQALSDLRAERDLLSKVLERMKEGVLVLDGDGRVALANPALREMLLLQNDIAGKLLLEVARNADLKLLLDEARQAEQPLSSELELGTLKPRRVLIHASALSEAEDAGSLLVVFVDVTDLRRLETLRRDFVANVSHELRTPIAAIRSSAETVLRALGEQTGPAVEFVQIIERQAERLQRLVEDLLDLSRIESRQFRFELQPVRVQEPVGHALSLLRERAGQRHVQLVSEVSPETLVRADARALEQVLTNLLDNAVKYGREGGRVVVRAQQDGAQLRVSVQDDGPGIEARHLPRLFERFYRVDAGRSRDLGGTGLGLSIVKHLVEGMGGQVDVQSAPGRGTTFVVTLPRVQARA